MVRASTGISRSALGRGPRPRTRQRLRCRCFSCCEERRTVEATRVVSNGVRGVELGDDALDRVAGPTGVVKSTAIVSSAAASAVMRSALDSGAPQRGA